MLFAAGVSPILGLNFLIISLMMGFTAKLSVTLIQGLSDLTMNQKNVMVLVKHAQNYQCDSTIKILQIPRANFTLKSIHEKINDKTTFKEKIHFCLLIYHEYPTFYYMTVGRHRNSSSSLFYK